MKIFDTDFSGATLEQVDFAGAKIKHVSFAGAKLIQVDFSKVLLAEEINFQDAQIVDCKFPEEVGSGLLYHENDYVCCRKYSFQKRVLVRML